MLIRIVNKRFYIRASKSIGLSVTEVKQNL